MRRKRKGGKGHIKQCHQVVVTAKIKQEFFLLSYVLSSCVYVLKSPNLAFFKKATVIIRKACSGVTEMEVRLYVRAISFRALTTVFTKHSAP